ncbi:hypothetical protein LTR82_005347 [Friedmanniomyces endolithicus]|uniref:RNA helicase n=1 Tax=Friedmanniomyces endolithicus TaxID=329885 RepID=A0AAN6FUQ1_9PEZI|nr:hypothetical protein LTR82_005347 [Friedmanniomyces endolithicus]
MADSDTFIPALHTPSALLPIARHRDALLYTIETHPVTILIGPTGSGKTTQLPQYLEQAGWCSDGKIIAVTQASPLQPSELLTFPRRIAATTIATRVAAETGTSLGQKVGYSIRFEDVTSAATKIKFLTDGLLLREALVDPLLSRYSVIMVDEAHERSLSSDVLLGILKKIRKKRPELRIVVSSATLQAEEFLRYFAGEDAGDGGAADSIGRIVSIEGRAFPVDIHYLAEPCEDYLERAVQTVFDIRASEPEGDILIFLPGRDDIQTAIEKIADRNSSLPAKADKLLPLPLYAGLTTDQQLYVFEPAPEATRKVICATNIAEASVTITGITHVIDPGYVKLRVYNPTTGIDTLTSTPISRASATQRAGRAGRAGRTKPGKCYRLYTESAFSHTMPETTVPEIQRSNLAALVLQLKALGIDNLARFDFLSPPPAELLVRALELLYALGALDDYAKLTKPLGTRIAELGIEPMLAKALLSSPDFGCVNEMLSIAAMIQVSGQGSGVWFSHDNKTGEEKARRSFAVEEGDHLTLLNVYQAFVTKGKQEAKWCQKHYLNFKTLSRAVRIRNQLRRALERFGIAVLDPAADVGVLKAGGLPIQTRILRSLTSGYFPHAARMQADGTFRSIGGQSGKGSGGEDGGGGAMVMHAHPSSLMFNRKAEWVVFGEVVEMRGKVYIREVSRVERGWLGELGGGYYAVR